MTLQYRNDTGAFLVKTDGTFMSACCCLPCNDCGDLLKTSYQVVISGMGGDFAQYNGTWTLDYRGFDPDPHLCYWGAIDTETGISLNWGTPGATVKRWLITCWVDIVNCGIGLAKVAAPDPDVPCDPTGVFNIIHYCNDASCADTGSCESSAGATATVSLVP